MSKSETDTSDSDNRTVSDQEKIRQLTDTLEQRDAQLAHAYDSLARFTSAISHDIHSPINTLQQLVGIFENDHAHQLDADGKEMVGLLQASATKTKKLADGIVKLSKKCKPTGPLTLVDTTALIDSVLGERHDYIKQLNLEVVVGKLPEFVGNPVAMHTVFSELMDNALKFGTKFDEQPRTFTISCEETDKHVEFLFDDQGIGIAQADPANIFVPLTRLHNHDVYQGAGLGLSLCTILVNTFRGRLWVSESNTGGCVFHVLLPKLPLDSDHIQKA